MITILTIIHILVCIFMVSIVLLQHGKGADIGATFGGGGQSLFGTEGPVPMLNKVTTTAAVVFMMTSISLAYLSAHRTTSSVMGDYSTLDSGVGNSCHSELDPSAAVGMTQKAARDKTRIAG